MSAKAKAELGFGAAMQELEEILRRVESDETDIDQLGEQLKRAAELLEICRGKIRRAEVEVSQIVQTLEKADTVPADRAEPTAAEPKAAATKSRESAPGATASLFEQDS